MQEMLRLISFTVYGCLFCVLLVGITHIRRSKRMLKRYIYIDVSQRIQDRLIYYNPEARSSALEQDLSTSLSPFHKTTELGQYLVVSATKVGFAGSLAPSMVALANFATTGELNTTLMALSTAMGSTLMGLIVGEILTYAQVSLQKQVTEWEETVQNICSSHIRGDQNE